MNVVLLPPCTMGPKCYIKAPMYKQLIATGCVFFLLAWIV